MVLLPARSCARGQRRPSPPSSSRRRGWLTPGRQPRKPDGYSAPLGTGQSPGGRGADERNAERRGEEEERKDGERREQGRGEVWREGREGRGVSPKPLPPSRVQTFAHPDYNSTASRAFAACPLTAIWGPLVTQLPTALSSSSPSIPPLSGLVESVALTPQVPPPLRPTPQAIPLPCTEF